MSTKKDGVKTSTSSLSKKKTTGASKSTTKTREDSTDRSNIKKTEVSNKIKKRSSSTTIANDNILEKVKLKENIKTTKPIKASVSLSDQKKVSGMSMQVSRKKAAPVTPPSNRVSKTQFFPSKNMYANALKSDETPAKKVASNTNKEIKKSDSKTETQIHKALEKKLSGRIVPKKVLDERSKNRTPINKGTTKSKDSFRVHSKETNIEVSPDSSSISERPRTATLRKGSIVNDNIVGPDAPKHLIPKVKRENTNLKAPSPEPEANEEYNYEDDFESYESDFEEYSSSSSSAADLGNISGEETSSVSTSSSSQNQIASLKLTSTKRKTNSAGNDDERKLDSGNFDMSDYKHKQLLDDIKESVEKENANLKLQEVQRNNPASLSDEGFEEQKSLQFINFLDAKRKYERHKSMEIRQRRGEEILNMIRLDTFSFTLFDMPPVPYEVFIKNYGGNNSLQSAVQTGEDDISEMTQTEEITSETKWTQFPIQFTKIDPTNSNYLQICRNSHLGVGGENVNESQSEKLLFNEHNLKKFLSCAGDLILKIQLESTERFDKFQKDPRDIPFSDGFVLFDTSHDFLRNCSIRCASFSCDNTNKMLTVHLPKRRENEGYYRSVVCVWNISRSDIPESIFVSYGDISCCTFGLNSTDFIYAGLKDGTISVWDTKRNIRNEDFHLKQVPLYSTEVGIGHSDEIISLQPFVNYTERIVHFRAAQTNEICSLDQGGDVILWSLILKQSTMKDGVISSTNWNDVILVKNIRVSLKTIYPDLADLQCTDCVVNSMDSNYIIVSTNYGFIIHHLIKGGRSNVKKFVPASKSCANCLEPCPFSPNYFLAGFSDGNINLYSRLVEKPLMVLSDKEGQFGKSDIQIIQWSRCRPFIIYTKDVNNTIHIWDLNDSDIYPIYSFPSEKNITCMKLSPLLMDTDIKKSYMITGTEDGYLYLHLLSTEHGQQSCKTYKEHVNTFLNYVDRL